MRDPARIKRTLGLIRKVWETYPDLRLYQLLGNCFGPGDHYYMEDAELEQQLKIMYPGAFVEEE